MKLHEEFKLFEEMWEARYCYIVLTGDFPNKYFVHGTVATEAEAKEILNKAAQGFSGDVEMAKLYDLTDSEAARLESMVGKEVSGADADFIADFFTDGSRVDSLYNNFNEAAGDCANKIKNPLKEAAPTTASAIIRRYEDNLADHILELEHEMAFADAEWFEDEWYTLENVKVDPDYFILVMDRPVESIQDAEAIISYAFSPANIVNIEEAMSEGGVVQDETSNELYIERWVIN